MTVCIAMVCRGVAGENLLALCTDGRLYGGQWGSDNAAVKIHTIGHNWLAMMSGHWSTARDLCFAIEKDITEGPRPSSKADIVQFISESASRFCSSPVCQKNVNCELLFTGFLGPTPVMAHLVLARKKADLAFVHDKFAIGEGAALALPMMNYRGYEPNGTPLAKACYLVYEAKKFSEAVDSVGRETRITIHAPVGDNWPSKAYYGCDMTPEGLQGLEAMRTKFFLQPLVELENFPESYFS